MLSQDPATRTVAPTVTRIGPGHYAIHHKGCVVGWLFDDIAAGHRPATDPDRWRFSPADGMLSFVARTKREALEGLRFGFE